MTDLETGRLITDTAEACLVAVDAKRQRKDLVAERAKRRIL